MSLNDTLRDARFQICRALVTGGHPAALACLGSQSIRLCRLVDAADLLWRPVFRNLLQVANNIGLVRVYGKHRVRTAIYAGLTFLEDLEAA